MLPNTFPLPNLFIPGVQKAGTTALASFLAQHKDICLVNNKEAHVFDHPELLKTKDKQKFIEESYASKLNHYNGEAYILDATPITMLHPTFVRECAASCPDAKHIVMLRDPVERAISHYAMSKMKGREDLSLFDALRNEGKRMEGFYDYLPSSDFKCVYRDQSYLIRGKYKQQLRSLYNCFPRNNIKIIYQEKLLKDHNATLNDIFNFLALEPQKIPRETVFDTKEETRVSRWLRLGMYAYFKMFDR